MKDVIYYVHYNNFF